MQPDIIDRKCPTHGAALMQRPVGNGKFAIVCPVCEDTTIAAFAGPACAPSAVTRNGRVSARYDELARIGKHGHYETMFQVVREEVERARHEARSVVQGWRENDWPEGFDRRTAEIMATRLADQL